MGSAVISVGGDGRFAFCAAHAGWHDGQFEPLHGHSFIVTLRLHGDVDQAGMVCDFGVVKEALAAVIAPLKRRTLMPARPPGGRCMRENGQLVIECGSQRYSLPAGDVVLLPVASTTTEVIAAWLLARLLSGLDGERVRLAELILAEAPGVCVTVSAQLGSGR